MLEDFLEFNTLLGDKSSLYCRLIVNENNYKIIEKLLLNEGYIKSKYGYNIDIKYIRISRNKTYDFWNKTIDNMSSADKLLRKLKLNKLC